MSQTGTSGSAERSRKLEHRSLSKLKLVKFSKNLALCVGTVVVLCLAAEVALLAVLVQQQRNMRTAIWVVFQSFDLTGYTSLIPLKINGTIMLFMPTTTMTSCYATFIVTSESNRTSFLNVMEMI